MLFLGDASGGENSDNHNNLDSNRARRWRVDDAVEKKMKSMMMVEEKSNSSNSQNSQQEEDVNGDGERGEVHSAGRSSDAEEI